MELSKQVCSLDLAKKLKELGVKQESLFLWKIVIDKYNVEPELVRSVGQSEQKGTYINGEGDWQEQYYSAFTVAEMGEMLPPTILKSIKLQNGWTITVTETVAPNKFRIFEADTEADARAKMLCYLLENKLINVQM